MDPSEIVSPKTIRSRRGIGNPDWFTTMTLRGLAPWCSERRASTPALSASATAATTIINRRVVNRSRIVTTHQSGAGGLADRLGRRAPAASRYLAALSTQYIWTA